MWSYLLLVTCVVVAANASAASFIQKCRPEDSKCQKDSAEAALPVFTDGIPELGIEKLDPLRYDKLDASSKRLILILNDIQIGGIKQCQIKKVKRDVPNSKLIVKVLCTLTIDGQYIINGSLLILPIRGEGKFSAKLRKILIDVEADLNDEVLKDGKKHWNIKTWSYTYELKDKAEIDLENLFEGNGVLGDAVRQMLKTSANEVINEIGDPIVKSILTKIIKVIKKFFKAVPVEDLSIE